MPFSQKIHFISLFSGLRDVSCCCSGITWNMSTLVKTQVEPNKGYSLSTAHAAKYLSTWAVIPRAGMRDNRTQVYRELSNLIRQARSLTAVPGTMPENNAPERPIFLP